VEKFEEFDCPSAKEFAIARQNFAKPLLQDLRSKVQLSSAVDVGCGVGYFSKFLHDLGFQVTGIDGREENVQECKRRYPEIKFLTSDAEDLPTEQIGTFDFVLCFGLLYHLENPFRAIRGLHSITKQVLLVESMCAPGGAPTMELLDEYRGGNQGLDFVAFYPTESCLVKMLYRAGFPFVYGFEALPAHEEFKETPKVKRRRTMLLATRSEVSTGNARLIPELVRSWDIWTTPKERLVDRASRLVSGARRRLLPSSNGASKKG
jgi:SAM-dependent methyltransferase